MKDRLWSIARLTLGIALLALAGTITAKQATGPVDSKYFTDLLDYGSFMHAAEALDEGRNPYAYHRDLQPPPSIDYGVNLNPPASLLLFTALHRMFTPETGRILIQVSTVVLFVLAFVALVRLYPTNRGPLTVAFLLIACGLGSTLWWGQIYGLLGALGAAGWILIDRNRPLAAGVAFGVVIALKPPFLLIPLWLAVSGRPRLAAPMVAVAAVLSLAPSVLWGPGVYRQWFELTTNLGSIHYEGWPSSSMSLTSASFVLFGTKTWGFIASCAIVAAFTAWLYASRRRLQMLDIVGYAMLVAAIVSPIAWPSYFVMVLPAVMSHRLTRSTWTGLILVWLSPGIGVLILLGARVLQDRRPLPSTVKTPPDFVRLPRGRLEEAVTPTP